MFSGLSTLRADFRMTFLENSFLTLNILWATLRRPGKRSNKTVLSLTSKGNSKYSKAVVTGLKKEKGVKGGGGDIVLPCSPHRLGTVANGRTLGKRRRATLNPLPNDP